MRTFVVREVGYGPSEDPPGEVVIRMFAEGKDAVPEAVEAGPASCGSEEYAEEMRAMGIGVAAIASRMGISTALFDETDAS